jgi:thiol-disulfide isomerase/thioredoxin
LVRGFVRKMKILVFSGTWCGDCIEQCPLLQRIAEENPEKIDLRFIERPREGELIPELRINGGNRVPVVLFFSEDDQWCATAGDRTVHRYRALAAADLALIARRASSRRRRKNWPPRWETGWTRSNAFN